MFMSNEKIIMPLKDYEGPFWPSELDDLHAAYADDNQIRREELEQMGARVTGFLGIEDAQDWFCQLTFQVGKNGKVAVVLPWFQDQDLSDGTTTDRHIALYVQGGVSPECMSSVAEQLFEKFKIVCNLRRAGTELWDDTMPH